MQRVPSRGDERGVATVMVVLCMPFVLLVLIFAVDVANWFVHKRHLQNEADAAALAGAGEYTFPSCDDARIRNAALRYSGKGDGVETWNSPGDIHVPQARLHAEINAKNYYNQSVPGDTDLPAEPCAVNFVDVKMTETDLPLFWGTGLVDKINAEARVKLFQVTEGEGLLPLGVQEAAPRKVRAYVVDETTGNTLTNPSTGNPVSVVLTQNGVNNGLQLYDNDTDPLTVDLPEGTSGNLGVRLALSGSATTTACGEPLVNCYDSVQTTNGLSYLRTYSTATSPATGQPPVLRSVKLVPTGTCANASFSSQSTACPMDVVATVRWAPELTQADFAAATRKAKLELSFNGNTYVMTYAADPTDPTNPGKGTWTASITAPTGTIGPKSMTMTWEEFGPYSIGSDTCKTGGGGGNKCTGSFGTVQRTFWNDAGNQSSRGGPVATLDVLDSTDRLLVSDLRRCTGCSASLLFHVGIKGALKLDLATDPPRSMRVSNSGSQNQTVDCDPGRDFVDEIAYGCQPRYAINTGTACSAPTNPVSCVPVQTGTTANKPAQGFNTRFLCAPPGNPGRCKGTPGSWDGKPDTCPAAGQMGHNNWPNYPVGDPRVVSVFLVPFGTFESAGNQLVPIIDMAAFYVTGWASNGAGFANPCIGNGDQFVPGTDGDNGVISGHFVKNVKPNAGGTPSGVTCDFNDIGECVAVLVK